MQVKIADNEILKYLLGNNDSNLSLWEDYLGYEVNAYKNELVIVCPTQEEAQITTLIETITRLRKQLPLQKQDLIFILEAYRTQKLDKVEELYLARDYIAKTKSGHFIYPKSFNQKEYFLALKNSALTFAVGPAGCGKTYLAVTYAARLLKEGTIKKIILTRPAVEAGESLGFLPGDLKEKVDPYLRPLYDALYEVLGKEVVDEKINQQIIEIAPLAYMRGRTLDNAFVILDEAQNTTYAQMKMFLTRMGFNSKMIITGDISQVDLPKGIKSGLMEALNILQGQKMITFINFAKIDVVRHPLVKKIIACYEEYESKHRQSNKI